MVKGRNTARGGPAVTDAGKWLFKFATGVIVREGAGFRTLQFHSPDDGAGRTIVANAAWVAADPVITLVE